MASLIDERMMRLALQQAELAYDDGEIPIGAIVAANGKILAKAYNQTERLRDVTAHAEILAITTAAQALGGKYLTDCTLYVTLEPCPMCVGALYWARPSRIVFAAKDLKRGYTTIAPQLVHPKTEVEYGLYADESLGLLQAFFKARREE